MKKWLLILAALLGAVLQSCGSSASDPRSGSAGNDDVDDSDLNSPCPQGMVEKKADDGRGTVCTVQPNVESDGATDDDGPGAGGSIDPTSDAGNDAEPTIPDAAAECPNLEGHQCTGEGMDPCTWHAVEGFCSFECTVPDGRMPYSVEESPEGARIMAQNCNITL